MAGSWERRGRACVYRGRVRGCGCVCAEEG